MTQDDKRFEAAKAVSITNDDYPTKQVGVEKIMGKPSPDYGDDFAEWYEYHAEFEAKLRIIKADALLAELARTEPKTVETIQYYGDPCLECGNRRHVKVKGLIKKCKCFSWPHRTVAPATTEAEKPAPPPPRIVKDWHVPPTPSPAKDLAAVIASAIWEGGRQGWTGPDGIAAIIHPHVAGMVPESLVKELKDVVQLVHCRDNFGTLLYMQASNALIRLDNWMKSGVV